MIDRTAGKARNEAVPDAPPPSFLFCVPWGLHHAGGVNQVVLNLRREMKKAGTYRPIVLIGDWNYPRPVYREDDGGLTILWRMRPVWSTTAPATNLLKYVLALPSMLWQLAAFLRRHNVRIVNAHYPRLSFLNFILLRHLGLFSGRIITSLHGTDLANAGQTRGIERRLWMSLLKLSDRVVTCSDALRRQALSFCPACDGNAVTIHNGVDLDAIRAAGNSERLPACLEDGGRTVLNVGTFDRAKGQDVLLAAFAEVAKKLPDANLVIIGRSGPQRDAIAAMARDLGLADRVFLIGDKPHAYVSAALKRAAVFVLPSRKEAFGIVLLEAGAAGLPVIATTVGGIPEFIAHGETGRLVPPEDPAALAREIETLLTDPGERARLGRNLRDLVERRFTWTKIYRQYCDLFRTADGPGAS